MKKLQKIIAIGLTCLTLGSIVSMVGCGDNESEEHTHEYVETDIPSTCTTKGYTEYKCSCGDSYTENEKDLLAHTGRYQCSMCQMDFGEAFKNITQQYGTNGVFTNLASNYTQQTYSNDNFECIMVFDTSVDTSPWSGYIGYLSYSSFDKKWTWMLEWDSNTAMGEFESLSSASTTVPCSYSTFNSSVASLMKSIFSTMVYNANVKLKAYNAGFTMENLGLKF